MTPEAFARARRMMMFARLDYVVLFLVVFDMVVKPTSDDVGSLLLMAVVFLAGAVYFGWRARSIEIGRTRSPAAESA